MNDIQVHWWESGDLIKQWIKIAPGAFTVADLTRDVEIQQALITTLEKFVDDGYLERHGTRRGWYSPRHTELIEMDYINASETPIDIWLPFDLDKRVQIYPGNIIIVAGTWNAGKTAILLNIILNNRYKFNVHYFNSEMSAEELKIRLQKFVREGIRLDQWNFKAYHRAERFDDVVFPGEGNLNVIDFLEVHDEFYIIGRRIKEIHDRLKGAIGIIALQKNPGQDLGLGGSRMMEVARLVLSVDPGRVKITKAKNFADPKINPNGTMRDFTLRDGYDLRCKNPWYRESKNGTKTPN